MLFFLCFSPTIKFQDGSPVNPLFEPPADPPFWLDLSEIIFIVISASLIWWWFQRHTLFFQIKFWPFARNVLQRAIWAPFRNLTTQENLAEPHWTPILLPIENYTSSQQLAKTVESK